MASLTQSSIIARKVIRYTIYGLIFIIILRFTINLGIKIYKKFTPPPEPEINTVFGQLPKLPFPDKEIPSNLTYTLETPDGELPQLLKQTEIYFMPPMASDIRSLDLAKEKAQALGFNRNSGRLLLENVPSIYIFFKNNAPSTLTMNIVSKVFSISYDSSVGPSIIGGVPPSPEVATTQVRSYLSSAGLMEEDLSTGRTAHKFLRIEGGKFVPAISLSEADVIEINLFRKGFGKDIPAVTPKATQANVWFLLSNAGTKQIVAAEYHYFPIEEQKSGIYPLKTSQQAWDELRSGEGYIANLGDNESSNIIIRKVYLGYYDAGQYTSFYQPVVVFEGDNDFTAYIPAVTTNFYGAEEKKE